MLRSYSLLALCLLSLSGAGFAAETRPTAQPTWSWTSPTSWLNPVRSLWATPSEPSAPMNSVTAAKKEFATCRPAQRQHLINNALRTLGIDRSRRFGEQLNENDKTILGVIGLLAEQGKKPLSPQEIAHALLAGTITGDEPHTPATTFKPNPAVAEILRELYPSDAAVDPVETAEPTFNDTHGNKVDTAEDGIGGEEDDTAAQPVDHEEGEDKKHPTMPAVKSALEEDDLVASATTSSRDSDVSEEDSSDREEATTKKSVATAEGIPKEHPHTPAAEKVPEESEGSKRTDEDEEIASDNGEKVAQLVATKPTPKVLDTLVVTTSKSSNIRTVVKALPATPASTGTEAISPQRSRINTETIAGSTALLLGLTLLSIVFTNQKSRMAFLSWFTNQEVPDALNRSPEELIARYGERKSAILLTAIGLIAMGGGVYGISRGLSATAAA
ncbi:MAG: hypothetical protein QG604_516 [Candidatus Dependentiae bacterium]|nr:hypothetical protein [Candidatus Dependentiae bacterium]